MAGRFSVRRHEKRQPISRLPFGWSVQLACALPDKWELYGFTNIKYIPIILMEF